MRARGKHSGRIEVHPGKAAVAAAAQVYRQVWQKACEHDSIPVDSKFCVFSDDNPFVQFIRAADREYQARFLEYQSGGYVGLKIE